jgi:lipopolysaccharide transport system permease protein
MELTSESIARVPTMVIQPTKGLFHLELGALWQYRELLYFLAWRDIKARYAQTVFGIGWAIIQPLFTMVIFTVIFGKFAKMPSDGLPYPIFAYVALIPWTYFARSVERSGNSLVSGADLVKKVYFPRLILPISATIGGLLDFIISFVVLLGMMAWYGFRPNWGMLALPFFLLLILITALSVSLWLSSLNTRYRDIVYVIPFLMQVWMYASPVVYPVSVVPERWRLLYSLNPMTGVIEGFRWALLGKKSPDFVIMALSMIAVLFIFLAGLIYFKRTERTFADIL